ncbi:MAG: alpha/beta fold hydrolase [Chloroflexi bacterium]|nr:MAG: alpha/beta fold hydrolase [Chloroflexota bacterium]
MTTETANRVQLAAGHWKPRFVANGIDANDFDRVLSETVEWRDWAPNWMRVGDEHRAIADEAERSGHLVTAADAYQRAAWCYHLGKFLWFEDRALHDDLRERTVATYAKALPRLDPPGRRIEAPFEGAIIPGILRAPRGASRPPVVILVPGLDSVKEELYAMENDFLRRGLATLTIDGPGQGENAPRFPIRADWSSVVSPLVDHLSADERGLDLGRVGLMGISMGGIYGPRAAAKEKRLRAIVALAGPYDLSECWAALNPLTKDGYVFYTHSRDEAWREGSALPAGPGRADRPRGTERDPAALPRRQSRLQQHSLQVPTRDGRLDGEAARRGAIGRDRGERRCARRAAGPARRSRRRRRHRSHIDVGRRRWRGR